MNSMTKNTKRLQRTVDMIKLPTLEVIITAHKEGSLLLPTFQSAIAAIKELTSLYSVQVYITIFLDNPDIITENFAKDIAEKNNAKLLYGKNGDPGQARNEVIQKADGEWVALLDGDDLWSENWLLSVYNEIEESILNSIEVCDNIYHPEYNLIFGGHEAMVRQGNRNDDFFDSRFLRSSNYWDALCVASKKTFLEFPYKKNDVSNGFAHEDYHWVCCTLDKKNHISVKDTIHFKRRRESSISSIASRSKVKVHNTSLQYY